MSDKKKTLLELIVDAHNKNKTSLVKEKEPKVLTPIIEELDIDSNQPQLSNKLDISHSNLIVNFNLNIGSEAIDEALQKSMDMAKGIAAGAAAMIGTAIVMNNTKNRIEKIKVPIPPKVKIQKA